MGEYKAPLMRTFLAKRRQVPFQEIHGFETSSLIPSIEDRVDLLSSLYADKNYHKFRHEMQSLLDILAICPNERSFLADILDAFEQVHFNEVIFSALFDQSLVFLCPGCLSVLSFAFSCEIQHSFLEFFENSNVAIRIFAILTQTSVDCGCRDSLIMEAAPSLQNLVLSDQGLSELFSSPESISSILALGEEFPNDSLIFERIMELLSALIRVSTNCSICKCAEFSLQRLYADQKLSLPSLSVLYFSILKDDSVADFLATSPFLKQFSNSLNSDEPLAFCLAVETFCLLVKKSSKSLQLSIINALDWNWVDLKWEDTINAQIIYSVREILGSFPQMSLELLKQGQFRKIIEVGIEGPYEEKVQAVETVIQEIFYLNSDEGYSDLLDAGMLELFAMCSESQNHDVCSHILDCLCFLLSFSDDPAFLSAFERRFSSSNLLPSIRKMEEIEDLSSKASKVLSLVEI